MNAFDPWLSDLRILVVDDEPNNVLLRIWHTSALLASRLRLPDDTIELIQRAAPLHDVGKIEIPLAGQIVAVADVVDALTHEPPYKPACPVDRTVGEICRQAGEHFDPRVVDAFCTLTHASLANEPGKEAAA
ncbi:MAG TPA: hypothetical protein VLC49_08725 [Solirubrobacteraceae bacterium]|nr:hypothetical protein [Solirubrobacteraceae bacterium]